VTPDPVFHNLLTPAPVPKKTQNPKKSEKNAESKKIRKERRRRRLLPESTLALRIHGDLCCEANAQSAELADF